MQFVLLRLFFLPVTTNIEFTVPVSIYSPVYAPKKFLLSDYSTAPNLLSVRFIPLSVPALSWYSLVLIYLNYTLFPPGTLLQMK